MKITIIIFLENRYRSYLSNDIIIANKYFVFTITLGITINLNTIYKFGINFESYDIFIPPYSFMQIFFLYTLGLSMSIIY